MKHVWGSICRASVTAAGVMVATSAASAEPAGAAEPAEAIDATPVQQIETEFEAFGAGDTGLDGASDVGVEGGVSFAEGPCFLEEVAPGASWEDAIATYLERFVDEPEEEEAVIAVDVVKGEPAAVAEPVVRRLPPELLEELGIDPEAVIEDEATIVDETADVFIEEPVALQVKAETGAEETKISLTPYLSHPMACEMCRRACDSIEQAGVSEDWFWIDDFAEPAATVEDFEFPIED